MPHSYPPEHHETWIDNARALGIMGIVMLHCMAPLWASSCSWVVLWALPLFFMLSGYGARSGDRFTRLIRTRSRSLLLPYAATCAAIYLYWQFVLPLFIPGEKASFNYILTMALYGASYPVRQFPDIAPVGPIWFLTVLFLATLIFRCILRATARFPLYVTVAAALAVSVAGIKVQKLLFLPWGLDQAMLAQAFMMFGYWLRRHGGIMRVKWWWLLLALAAYIVGGLPGDFWIHARAYKHVYSGLAGGMAGSLLACAVAAWLARFGLLSRALSYVARSATVILCFHLWDVGYMQLPTLAPEFMQAVTSHPLLHFAVRMAACLALSTAIGMTPYVWRAYLRAPLRWNPEISVRLRKASTGGAA